MVLKNSILDDPHSMDQTIEAQKERLKEKDKVKMASQMPRPSGYKLLIALPEVDETTEGGLIKATETMQREEVSSVCGFVIEVGPDAYPEEKFPSGPWCKKGDWIMMKPYSGTRFKIHGKEFRLINDDSVDAVVADPQGIIKV